MTKWQYFLGNGALLASLGGLLIWLGRVFWINPLLAALRK